MERTFAGRARPNAGILSPPVSRSLRCSPWPVKPHGAATATRHRAIDSSGRRPHTTPPPLPAEDKGRFDQACPRGAGLLSIRRCPEGEALPAGRGVGKPPRIASEIGLLLQDQGIVDLDGKVVPVLSSLVRPNRG